VGDYTDNKNLKSFNPSNEGFTYGTYIHGENLTGLLYFVDRGVIQAPFTWEFNVGVYNKKLYWGGIDCCLKIIKESDLDENILVGWRGPSINMKHMKDLPSKIKLYDTWWNDYGVSKYHVKVNPSHFRIFLNLFFIMTF
jgi:hypothetical protein